MRTAANDSVGCSRADGGGMRTQEGLAFGNWQAIQSMGLFQWAKGSAGHGHIDQDGLDRHRASALEQLHGQARVMAWQERQPQGRRRWLCLSLEGPKYKDRPLGVAGSELEPTKGLWLGGGIEPGNQGTKTVAAQTLLECPETVCSMACPDH